MKTVFTGLIAALMIMASTGAYARDMIQIKGSDTLINLVQKLAEEYTKKTGTPIAVTGGGSGTGIAALINDNCDIANASRVMKAKEVARASDNGVSIKRVVVAMDGLSVIVNPASGVEKLTMDQIGKIFRGEVSNWSQVGGNSSTITLYGRQSNSGTFVFFRDAVVKGDYSAKMNRMNGNSQLIEAVKSDVGGIAYVGVGYVKEATGINVVKVSAREGMPYASPLSSADVKSGAYPIARPLNQYVNGTPTGAVLDFIKYELSYEGQKHVEEEGFFPIPGEYSEFNKNSVGI